MTAKPAPRENAPDLPEADEPWIAAAKQLRDAAERATREAGEARVTRARVTGGARVAS